MYIEKIVKTNEPIQLPDITDDYDDICLLRDTDIEYDCEDLDCDYCYFSTKIYKKMKTGDVHC